MGRSLTINSAFIIDLGQSLLFILFMSKVWLFVFYGLCFFKLLDFLAWNKISNYVLYIVPTL